MLISCLSCQQDKPKAFYEIGTEEKIQFRVASFQDEPYYWEWINQEEVAILKQETRVYNEAFVFTKMQNGGSEMWTFQGLKTGTDTLKFHLRTYEEDTLNVPVIDSLIIAVKVN
jgi:predicted secreted protein